MPSGEGEEMGISVSVEESKETVIYFCDRCKREGLPSDSWVRLQATRPDGSQDSWDLCPNCYSEVMDGAISFNSES